jgi:hypothetical protein
MNAREDEKIAALLKRALPRVTEGGPSRDLWPHVLRRLDQDAVRVHWFDWALAAALVAMLLLNPEAIPVLFYFL